MKKDPTPTADAGARTGKDAPEGEPKGTPRTKMAESIDEALLLATRDAPEVGTVEATPITVEAVPGPAAGILAAAPGMFSVARHASGCAAILFEHIRREKLYEKAGYKEMRDYASTELGVNSESYYKKTARAGRAAWDFIPERCQALVAQVSARGGSPSDPPLPAVPNRTLLALMPAALRHASEVQRAEVVAMAATGDLTEQELYRVKVSAAEARGKTGGSAATTPGGEAPNCKETPEGRAKAPDETSGAPGGGAPGVGHAGPCAETMAPTCNHRGPDTDLTAQVRDMLARRAEVFTGLCALLPGVPGHVLRTIEAENEGTDDSILKKNVAAAMGQRALQARLAKVTADVSKAIGGASAALREQLATFEQEVTSAAGDWLNTADVEDLEGSWAKLAGLERKAKAAPQKVKAKSSSRSASPKPSPRKGAPCG